MKAGKILAIFLALALVIPVIAGCAKEAPAPPTPAPAPAPAPKPPVEVTVCTISGLTGGTAATHLMCDAGWKDYIRYVNEKKGGFKGKNGTVIVKNISYDSEYKIDKAKEMFARAKAAGAIAHSHCASGHSDGLMPDYEAAKIPLITGSVGVASAWSDWCYATVHAGAPNMGRTYVKWRYDVWVKAGKPGGTLKLSSLAADLPFTPLVLYEVEEFAESLDPNIEMTVELFPPAATDVTAQALRLKEKGVESIFGTCPPGITVMSLKSVIRAGIDLNETLYIIPCCSAIDDCVSLAGPGVVEGALWEGYYVPFGHGPDIPDPEGLKIGRWIWENWHKGEGPIRDLLNIGLPSGAVLEEAITLALDEIQPEELTGETLKIHGLDRIKDFDTLGMTAPFSYKPDDHFGPKKCIYWQLKEGKLVNYSGFVDTTTTRVPQK